MAQPNTFQTATGARQAAIDEGLRAHMNKVYGTMSVGMVITALAAWAIAGLATTNDPAMAAAELTNGKMLTSLGTAIYGGPLRWVIMLAPLAFVFFGWGALLRRGSAATVQTGFYAFAAFMGLSISSIFIVYTAISIAQVFLITAISFAALSMWGYTTKKDISGWGSFLIMGLVGGLIASIVNMLFFQDFGMAYAINLIMLLVFAGLTAWETQTVKNEYVAHAAHGDQEWLDKSAINGAFGLYLSFLNMFMILMSLLGQQE